MSALFAGLAAALRTGADTMQWNWRARRVEEVEERRAKHEEKALIRKEARVKAATIAAETRKEAAMQRKIDKGWVELPGAARDLDENVAEAARIQADKLAGARQKSIFGLRNKARVDAASLLRKQKTTDAKTLRGQKLDDAELLRQQKLDDAKLLRQQKLDDAKAKRELADQKAKEKKLEDEVKGYGTVRGVKNTQYFNQAMAEKRLYLSITDKGYQKKEFLHTVIDGENVKLSGEDPRYMDELDKHAFRRTFEGYSPETQALMAAKKWRGSEDWMTPEEAAEAAKTDLDRWLESDGEASQGEAAAPAAAPAPEAAPEAAPGGDPAAVTDVPDGDVFFDLSRGARRSYLKALGRGTLLRIRGELYRVDANGDIYRVDANGDMYKAGSR